MKYVSIRQNHQFYERKIRDQQRRQNFEYTFTISNIGRNITVNPCFIDFTENLKSYLFRFRYSTFLKLALQGNVSEIIQCTEIN